MEPKTPPFGGNHKVKFAENEGGKSFDDTLNSKQKHHPTAPLVGKKSMSVFRNTDLMIKI